MSTLWNLIHTGITSFKSGYSGDIKLLSKKYLHILLHTTVLRLYCRFEEKKHKDSFRYFEYCISVYHISVFNILGNFLKLVRKLKLVNAELMLGLDFE